MWDGESIGWSVESFEIGPPLAAFQAEAKLFLTDVTCVSGVKFMS